MVGPLLAQAAHLFAIMTVAWRVSYIALLACLALHSAFLMAIKMMMFEMAMVVCTSVLQSYKVLHYNEVDYNLLVVWAVLAASEVFQDWGEVGAHSYDTSSRYLLA